MYLIAFTLHCMRHKNNQMLCKWGKDLFSRKKISDEDRNCFHTGEISWPDLTVSSSVFGCRKANHAWSRTQSLCHKEVTSSENAKIDTLWPYATYYVCCSSSRSPCLHHFVDAFLPIENDVRIYRQFFYWSTLKMTKCQTLRKFWHLELFRWDLLCNPTLSHF